MKNGKSKNKTGIRGLTERWRRHKHHDSHQVGITTIRPTKWISAKDHPTARQIDQYLKAQRLKLASAIKDNHFQTLRQRLLSELSQQHGLAAYKAMERLALQTRKFNFIDSIEQFADSKSTTSVPMKHKAMMINIWIPFYMSKGCNHPRDFISWRKQAQQHVKIVKKQNSEEKYSVNTYTTLTNTHNEYMKFLLDNGDITETDFFVIHARITTEMRKRGLSSQSRKRDTYSEEEIIEIKTKIDITYAGNLHLKLRAYAIYFGVCTGVRRGNLLGLRTKDLKPDDKDPHFVTRDNVVAGWSRGVKGDIILENSTKTFVGTVKLPLVQPSPETLIEVARFLKLHLPDNDRLLNCSTSTVDDWWSAIAKDCGFKFLTPHDWKHSYATIGALHLHDWYFGNVILLHQCCLHEKFETTLKYVNQRADNFLKAFRRS